MSNIGEGDVMSDKDPHNDKCNPMRIDELNKRRIDVELSYRINDFIESFNLLKINLKHIYFEKIYPEDKSGVQYPSLWFFSENYLVALNDYDSKFNVKLYPFKNIERVNIVNSESEMKLRTPLKGYELQVEVIFSGEQNSVIMKANNAEDLRYLIGIVKEYFTGR